MKPEHKLKYDTTLKLCGELTPDQTESLRLCIVHGDNIPEREKEFNKGFCLGIAAALAKPGASTIMASILDGSIRLKEE